MCKIFEIVVDLIRLILYCFRRTLCKDIEKLQTGVQGGACRGGAERCRLSERCREVRERGVAVAHLGPASIWPCHAMPWPCQGRHLGPGTRAACYSIYFPKSLASMKTYFAYFVLLKVLVLQGHLIL